MSSVEKSALVRAQEAQLAALDQKVKQTRKTIKSLKTRLSNTQRKIEGIQRDVFSSATKMEERLRSVVEKIRQITQKLKTDKRLDADVRREITGGVDILLQGMGLEEETMEEQMRQQAEAREKARSHDAFAGFRIAPDKEDSRDIRKIYLALSKQFHPDKAKTAADKKRFQHLQQQIIEAYELGDYETLMELQTMYQAADTLGHEQSSETTDALAHKIALYQQQLKQLVHQKERISQEIKALRKSELGQMLTDVDSLARDGVSLEESFGITDMEDMVYSLEQYHEALVDTDRLGRLSPKFDGLFALETGGALEEMEELMDAMGMSPDDLFDLFGAEEEDVIYNPRPKFNENALVELTRNFRLTQQDGFGGEVYFETDGLSGTVLEALLHPETHKPIYTVRLDSKSLQKLDPEYCRNRIEDEEPIDFIFDIAEAHLKKKVKKRRESIHAQMKAARKLQLNYQFEHLSRPQLDLLKQILTTDVEEPDPLNWLAYLSEHFVLPLPLQPLTPTQQWKANKVAILHGVVSYAPYEGLIVIVEIAGKDYEVPLRLCTAKKGDRLREVLDLYRIWLDHENEKEPLF